jgi:TRAP-type C4-dicarboxylate transport system substrate-binding protein
MKMKKKAFVSIMSLFVILAFFSIGQAEVMTIKFADALPSTWCYYQGMKAFKQYVEEKLPGRVKVELYTDGVLGDQKTLLESTRMGAIQMAFITNAISQAVAPSHRVWAIPYMFKTAEDFYKFAYGPVAIEVGNDVEKAGLKFITWTSAGERGIALRETCFTNPETMKGMKIRVMQDPFQASIIKHMGGIPVAMSLAEVYTALQTGQIDGAELGPTLTVTGKYVDVSKAYARTIQFRIPGEVIANLKWWNGLPPDIRKVLEDGIPVLRKVNDDYIDKNEGTSEVFRLKFMEERGIKMCEVDLEAFKQATAPVVGDLKKVVGDELVEKVLKAVGY